MPRSPSMFSFPAKREVRSKAATRQFSKRKEIANDDECIYNINKLALAIGMDNWELEMFLSVCRKQKYFTQGQAILQAYSKLADDITILLDDRSVLCDRLLVALRSGQRVDLTELAQLSLRLWVLICRWRQLQWSPQPIMSPTNPALSYLQNLYTDTSDLLPLVSVKDTIEDTSPISMGIVFAPVMDESSLFHLIHTDKPIMAATEASLRDFCHTMRSVIYAESQAERTSNVLASLKGGGQSSIPTLRLNYRSVAPPIMGSLSASHEVYSAASTYLHKLLATTYSIHDYVDDSYYTALTCINELNHHLQNQKSRAKSPLRPAALLLQRPNEQISEPTEQDDDEAILPSFTKASPRLATSPPLTLPAISSPVVSARLPAVERSRNSSTFASTTGNSSYMTKQLQENLLIEAKEKSPEDEIDPGVSPSKSADIQEVQPSTVMSASPELVLGKVRSNSAPAHRRPMSRGKARPRSTKEESIPTKGERSDRALPVSARASPDTTHPSTRASSPSFTFELLNVTVPCLEASLGVECRRVRESVSSYCLLVDRYQEHCHPSIRKSLRVGDEILRIGDIDVQGMHHKELATILREIRPRSSNSKSPLPIQVQIKRSSTASQSSTGLQSVEEGRDSQGSRDEIPPPPPSDSPSKESLALEELSDQLARKRSEIEAMESAMEEWNLSQFKSGKGSLLQLYSELRRLQDNYDVARTSMQPLTSSPMRIATSPQMMQVDSPVQQPRKSGHSLAGRRLLETKSSNSIGSNSSPIVVERRRYSSNNAATSRKISAGRRRLDSDEEMTSLMTKSIPEGRVFNNSPQKKYVETTPSAMLLNLESVHRDTSRSRASSTGSDEVEYLTTPHHPINRNNAPSPVHVSSPLKSGRKHINNINVPIAHRAMNNYANRARKSAESRPQSTGRKRSAESRSQSSSRIQSADAQHAPSPKSAVPKHMLKFSKLFARNESFNALQNALRTVDSRKKPLVVTCVSKIIVWWRMVYPRKKLARRMEVRGLALEIIDEILDDSIITAIRLARGRDRMMRNGAAISIQYHFRRWRDRYLSKVKRIQLAWKRALARIRVRLAVRIFRAAIIVYRFIFKRKKRLGHIVGKKVLFRRVVRTFVEIYGIRQRECKTKVYAKNMLPMFAHMGKAGLMGNDRRNKMHHRRYKAAAKLQSFWRMILAMDMLEKLRTEKSMRHKIVTAILSFRLRRKILRRRDEKRVAIMVQKRWRGYLVRKLMMIKVLAGIKITSTWRRCRSYKKIKAHLRRIERPVEIVLHGLREIPPQMLYSKEIKIKISVWWSSLLHLVSQSDFETVINSKEPQVVYTTPAFPAVIQQEALPQPKKPLNSSKSNDSSDGSADTQDTAAALAATKSTFQSPFPKELNKFPKPHIKRTISPVIESNLNEEDSARKVPPKLDSGYLSRLPSIRDILSDARSGKDEDKPDSPSANKSPRSPTSSTSHSPRHTLGMMKHTAMQSLAMLKSFSSTPTSPHEKPAPPPPGPKKNPRCMCDFKDTTFNIPGCHGNSVLRFDIYDGERKFASHVFHLSREDRLLFWGGEYVRPVVISKVKRKVQLNANTITTRERSHMLNFDSSPVFEFRVVSGAAGKSMADWASVSVRGTGPLKLKMRTRGFIQSFFDNWDRMFLSLTGDFLLFCDGKKALEPFLRLSVSDIKSVKVELGKGATKKSAALVEDIHDVILVTNVRDDVYLRFSDANIREKWVVTLNKAIEDANNIFKRLNIPDALAGMPIAGQSRRGGPRQSSRRSSSMASRQNYSVSL